MLPLAISSAYKKKERIVRLTLVIKTIEILHNDRSLFPLGETSMVIVEKVMRRFWKGLDKVQMLRDFFIGF